MVEETRKGQSLEPLRTPVAKRTVSFSTKADSAEGSSNSGSLTSTATPSAAAMTPTNSTSGTGTSAGGSNALKPALKAGTERKKLPPPNQYQHTDPIIRRLRLLDNGGNPVDLQSFFKNVKVVAFYFSSQWAGQPLKEYHKTISDFASQKFKEFKVIYVSVDVDEQWYKAGVKGQPWVSMVWNDGSSSPAPVFNETSTKIDDSAPEPPALYNNEDFLMAQELDIDESLSKTDTSGQAYLRPFSRVHLASKLNIIAAPTLCIYNLENQKMLDWNVRVSKLSPSKRDETWSRWKKGEVTKSPNLSEAIRNSPITFTIGLLALAYYILLLYGGQRYNIVHHFFGQETRAAETFKSEAMKHVEF